MEHKEKHHHVYSFEQGFNIENITKYLENLFELCHNLSKWNSHKEYNFELKTANLSFLFKEGNVTEPNVMSLTIKLHKKVIILISLSKQGFLIKTRTGATSKEKAIEILNKYNHFISECFISDLEKHIEVMKTSIHEFLVESNELTPEQEKLLENETKLPGKKDIMYAVALNIIYEKYQNLVDHLIKSKIQAEVISALK